MCGVCECVWFHSRVYLVSFPGPYTQLVPGNEARVHQVIYQFLYFLIRKITLQVSIPVVQW